MDDPGFLKRFAQASRPGAYLRIITEGELGSGDAIEVVDRPDHGVTMRLISDAILLDPSLIPDVLLAPQLMPSMRASLSRRIS